MPIPSWLEAQELLARLALEDNDMINAAEEADKALGYRRTPCRPRPSTPPWTGWLTRRKPWIGRVLAKNPHDGGYETAAHFFILNRRYEEGIAYYRKAIAIDPDLCTAHSNSASI